MLALLVFVRSRLPIDKHQHPLCSAPSSLLSLLCLHRPLPSLSEQRSFGTTAWSEDYRDFRPFSLVSVIASFSSFTLYFCNIPPSPSPSLPLNHCVPGPALQQLAPLPQLGQATRPTTTPPSGVETAPTTRSCKKLPEEKRAAKRRVVPVCFDSRWIRCCKSSLFCFPLKVCCCQPWCFPSPWARPTSRQSMLSLHVTRSIRAVHDGFGNNGIRGLPADN